MNAITDFIFYYFISVLIVLGVLVFCHELGHFLLAKLFKVKVLKFALGFGPKIVWKQIGETEYSIRWIPLGGFVKLLGEDDDEEIKNLPPEEAARSLDKQSVFKKIAILAAGSIFNILLTFFIIWGSVFAVGEPVLNLKVVQVVPDAPAQKAGLLLGDVITALNNEMIRPGDGLQEFLLLNGQDPFSLTVLREKKTHVLQVVPRKEIKEFGKEKIRMGFIGIGYETTIDHEIQYGFGSALLRSLQKTWDLIRFIILTTMKLFQRDVPASSLGGIVGIGKMTGDAVKQNPLNFISIIALLGVAIGLLNLFPIPILDGSLIVIAIIEAVRRKPLSTNQKEWIFKIGLAFLITLMLFATYNDIFRLIRK